LTLPAVLQHSWFMTQRQLRALLRQPAWIVVTLVQPVMWLLLFGALFKSIVELPGFSSDSYADFLTPGIVVMTALFSAGWAGMGLLQDYDRGILDRFLTTPSSRIALIAGPLVQQSIVTVVQSLIIIVLGLVVADAEFAGGMLGALVVIVAAILLGMAIGALSNALALVVRKEETVIATVTSLTLPLSFLSGTFMDLDLAPSWIRTVAKYNPLEWAVVAGREALTSDDVDWGVVGVRLALLLALLVDCFAIATRAFRAYQRSV
jgi:ABC-2 type transport system permease protein